MLHFSAKRLSPKILPVDLSVQSWSVGVVNLKIEVKSSRKVLSAQSERH